MLLEIMKPRVAIRDVSFPHIFTVLEVTKKLSGIYRYMILAL